MLECPQCARRFDASTSTCPFDGAALRADATTADAVLSSVTPTNIVPTDTAATNIASTNQFPLPSITNPLIGRVLDKKYRLETLLGTGGMGSVYQATHLLIERLVAVKVLNPRLLTDEASKERLRREARAAGRLRHANAVAVTDFGETADGIVYIVMELLEGESVRERLRRDKPFTAALAVGIITQAAAAVAAAHAQGIIHRDLKPGNIHLIERQPPPPQQQQRTPLVKVLDFGIAKIAPDTESAEGENLETLTVTGILVGTPRYMSPEQCNGGELTAASDVYSLGVMLYEMLCGTTPFNGTTPLAIAMQHLSESPRALRELKPDVPPEIERIVMHALEKNPAARPVDAAAFNRELTSAAERAGISFTTEHQTTTGNQNTFALNLNHKSKTAGLMIASLAAAGLLVGALAMWGLFGRQAISEQQAATNQASVTGNSSNVNQNQSGDVSIGRSLTETTDDANNNSVASSTPSREPSTAGEFYERATAFYAQRDYRRAIEDLRRALELQPDFAQAHNRLGVSLLQNGQLAEAAKEFRRAIEQQAGNYPEASYNLGFALLQRGNNREALDAFREAIAKKNGDYPDAYYQTGIVLLNLKRDAEAIEALTKTLELKNGNDAEASFALGTAYARQKNEAAAETALRQAIEQRGSYPSAHYNLALLYENNNRLQEAITEYETYLQQQPNAFNRRLVENSLRRLRARAREI